METSNIKKCTSLNYKEKLEIIKLIENGESRKNICGKFNCSAATITRILKSKAILETFQHNNLNLAKKRNRCGAQENVEKSLSIWFKEMRAKDATITGSLIMEKATVFAKMLNVNFIPSVGWLDRWKKRENINLKVKHAEKACADTEGANNWIDAVLPKYLKDYSADCIYNADESALLFKTISTSTSCYRNEQVAGKKLFEDRLTLLFVTNSTGNDKLLYSIGKSKNPRCFRNRTIPVHYFSNKNAWMTQVIWSSILQDINQKMKAKNKKIVLFVDNATCHNVTFESDYVKIVILPPNATSIIQPLDQGIIRSFKTKYRQDLVRKHLMHIQSGLKSEEFTRTINVFEALKMAKIAWSNVTSTTIEKCFIKARFMNGNVHLTEASDIIISNPLEDGIQDLIDIDLNLECCGSMTDADIISSITPDSETDSEPDSDLKIEFQSCEFVKPTLNEALKALDTLQSFLQSNPLN